eukprot:13918065-Alexandrium_andersonii.AAC.1
MEQSISRFDPNAPAAALIDLQTRREEVRRFLTVAEDELRRQREAERRGEWDAYERQQREAAEREQRQHEERLRAADRAGDCRGAPGRQPQPWHQL